MAVRLTPVGWIAKFLVAPAALAAIGYFVVGPRIGATAKAKPALSVSDSEPASSSVAPATEPTDSDSPKHSEKKPVPPAPDVDVSVKPIDPAKPGLGADADVQTSNEAAPTSDDPKPRQRRIPSGTSGGDQG